MSSNLKPNNRFQFLDEDQNKNEPIKKTQNASFREKERDIRPKYQTYNKFKIENKESIIKNFEIKENEFPELSFPIKNISNDKQSFINSLKKEKMKENEFEEEKIPFGWVLYKINKQKNGLFNHTKSILSVPLINVITNNEIIENKIEIDESEEIINSLFFLHEKRTKEYIELWGEDEYERMFMCPNHDYEYFDKLDEAYQIEQDKINEQYSNDVEYYDDYKSN